MEYLEYDRDRPEILIRDKYKDLNISMPSGYEDIVIKNVLEPSTEGVNHDDVFGNKHGGNTGFCACL